MIFSYTLLRTVSLLLMGRSVNGCHKYSFGKYGKIIQKSFTSLMDDPEGLKTSSHRTPSSDHRLSSLLFALKRPLLLLSTFPFRSRLVRSRNYLNPRSSDWLVRTGFRIFVRSSSFGVTSFGHGNGEGRW